MPRRAATAGWETELTTWLEPFWAALPRCTHRKWAPRYVEGLLGPAERKSIERLADQVAAGDYDQLHHFLTTTAWDAAPLLRVLAQQAQALVGGSGAVLIIDDTTLLKQGTHSVGVTRQYSGRAGKLTNCQCLVSLTLARGEVPVPVALRLFVPASWAGDLAHCAEVGIPFDACVYRPKWALALEELDRVEAAGVRFDVALADAAYGMCAGFRQGLSARGLTWAVGILAAQQVYPASVTLTPPAKPPRGRPPRHPVPSRPSVAAAALIDGLGPRAFRTISWRAGTKGPLAEDFAAVRVRIADGPKLAHGQRLPGQAGWLVCERRASGERQYYLTNHPARTPLRTLAAVIKARWVCEQGHQQLKEELGLDHFEGRSWTGLHHHVLLTMIAFAFLQHYRLTHRAPAPGSSVRGKNPHIPRAPARPQSPRHPPSPTQGGLAAGHLPTLRHAYPTAA